MSSDTQQDLSDLFKQVEHLLLVESPKDLTSDPFKSKYKARDLLEVLKIQLQFSQQDESQRNAMLAHVWLQIGIICVDTDEIKQGEDSFDMCINLMKSRELTPECIITCVSVYNNLGLVWSHRTEWEKAFEYLRTAEKFYKDYSASKLEPVDPRVLFTSEALEEKVPSLEKLYTLTLYYLAQCYMQTSDSIKSTICCHTTLKRQLEFKDYNHSEWSLNMATLSQVCIENNSFEVARECLYGASKIHTEYVPTLNEMKDKNPDKYETEYRNWRNAGADIDRCWGKYGIILLTVSRERLMIDDDVTNKKQFEPCDELKELTLGFPLPSSPPPITASYVLTYSDAIKVFNIAHKHLQQAQAHYSLDEFATDHARVVQEISSLYSALVFFVESEAEQCKFHKRRITELEKTVKQFNPKFYVTLCREIWFELGEIYSDMYELKAEILRKTAQPSQHQVAKINWLIKNSLTHYIELIDSFKDTRTNEYPTKYSDEWEKPVLLAFFYSARLLTKLLTNDKSQLKKNQTEALNNYRYIIEYCAKNKEATEKFATELSLCQEMVNLLSLKIQRIAAQIASS